MRAGIWRWQSSRAPSFADAFAATLGEETRPQRRGILYTDEVIGGNILSAQKKKKNSEEEEEAQHVLSRLPPHSGLRRHVFALQRGEQARDGAPRRVCQHRGGGQQRRQVYVPDGLLADPVGLPSAALFDIVFQ